MHILTDTCKSTSIVLFCNIINILTPTIYKKKIVDFSGMGGGQKVPKRILSALCFGLYFADFNKQYWYNNSRNVLNRAIALSDMKATDKRLARVKLIDSRWTLHSLKMIGNLIL